MKFRSLALAFTLVPCFAFAAGASVPAGPSITLNHGMVWRTKAPGVTTQGFLQIHNTGDTADTLTGANCTIAASTTLVDKNGKVLRGLEIPPGKTVTLSPDGPHLVIADVRYRVKKDGILPCAINFASSGTLVGYLNAISAPRS